MHPYLVAKINSFVIIGVQKQLWSKLSKLNTGDYMLIGIEDIINAIKHNAGEVLITRATTACLRDIEVKNCPGGLMKVIIDVLL